MPEPGPIWQVNPGEGEAFAKPVAMYYTAMVAMGVPHEVALMVLMDFAAKWNAYLIQKTDQMTRVGG